MGGSKKSSFHNQASSSSDQRRRASKGEEQTKASRGNPSAGCLAWFVGRHRQAKLKCIARGPAVLFVGVQQRNCMVSLPTHMPNLPDTDARTLALRMFYIEVSNVTAALW